jgi:AP-1-like transcription factor
MRENPIPIVDQRRRAQNRAAQRAFRERKEKRAKELEEQLAEMSAKYKDLELEHLNLQDAHEKLQQTLELLTCDDDGRTSGEQLRRFLNIIQGKARTRVKVDTE